MNQFKRYIYPVAKIAVCLLLLIQFPGCNRGLVSGGEGTLSVDFGAVNDEVTVKSAGSSGKAGLVYVLDVVDQQGDTVAHYPDHRQARSIRLVEGKYTIIAEDNSPASADPFGEPRFGSSQEVIIKAGENTPVMMACSLINVKVTVAFDQDIQDNFTDYSLTIKPTLDSKDSLIFRQTEMDSGQIGWINQTRKGTFVLIFRARNQQSPDKLMEFVRTIADAQPADFYRLTFKINPTGGASDGGALFRLSVRTDLTEYEFPLGVKDQTRPIPVVVRHDGISIREPMATNVVTRDGQPRIDIRAEAGIQRLRIRHTDPAVLLKYGLPGVITLGGDNTQAEDEALRQQMAGIVTWSDKRLVGEPDAWVDFSGLVNTAMLGGELLPEGIYPVDIEVYDFDNQMKTQTIYLSVAKDFATGTVDGPRARFATLNAKWLGKTTPTGLGFEYRVAGTGDDHWTGAITARNVIVDEPNKSFSALIQGLQPSIPYEFRPIGDELTPGSTGVFMSGAYTDISAVNYSFDAWTSDGKSWYPNAVAGNSYWASGNAGVTMAGKESNTTGTTDVAVAGAGKQAAKLVSLENLKVIGIGVDHAAGNLFCGSFVVNTSAMKESPKFGRPFKGRPTYFEGYFKYTSTTITKKGGEQGAPAHPDLVGQPDQCQIYVSLEYWGTAEKRPLGVEIPSDDMSEPSVVGFAELHTVGVVNMSDYVHFVLPIRYKEGAPEPDHIVVVATSSRWGGDFCGGVGSTLYVDEFNFGWDFDIPASEWVQPAD